MGMPRQLKGQVWQDWIMMAGKSLAGAARIAWQSESERRVEMELFAKVTGSPLMRDSMWRNSMTWSAATLLGLSIEQGFKALAIRRSSSGSVVATHDLVTLWEALPEEDHDGIAEEARRFRRRVAGTRFDAAPDLSEITALVPVIHHHRHVFQFSRYHMEGQSHGSSGGLTENISLWVVAIVTYCYARKQLDHECLSLRT